MKLNTFYNPERDVPYVELPFYETWHGHCLSELDIQQFAAAYCERYGDTDPEGVRQIMDYGVSDYADLPETAQEVWQNEWEFDYGMAKVFYAYELFNYMAIEYGLELTVVDISPTQDNFQRPDLAVLHPIGIVTAEKISGVIRANEDLRQKLGQRIQELTTRRDGYIPFYTEEELWADRGWLTQLSLGILLDEFLGDYLGWLDTWQTSVMPSMENFGSWKEAA